jgi:hypothetical protein
MQESGVREIRTLRLTRRGLETWHGRDHVTLADERASNGEPNIDLHLRASPRPYWPARSVASAMRAQSDNRPQPPAVDPAPGAAAQCFALIRVLPRAADFGGRPGADAPYRRAAPRAPVRRQPHAA